MQPSNRFLQGLKTLANETIEHLAQEHDQLLKMNEQLRHKMQAIKTHDAEQLAAATLTISEVNQTLEELSTARDRKLRLLGQLKPNPEVSHSLEGLINCCHNQPSTRTLGKELATWQKRLREQALKSQKRCEEVAFALQYATHLGQEMLYLLQGQTQENATYTTEGKGRVDATSSSLVNRLG